MKLCDKLEKEEFVKEGVLQNFTKFTGKTFVEVSFLIKLQVSGLNLYLKKRFQYSCFPLNLVKFFEFLNFFFSAGCFCTKAFFCEFFRKKEVLNKSFFNLS